MSRGLGRPDLALPSIRVLSRLALPTPALSRLELIGAVTLLAAAIVPVQVRAQIPPPVNAVPQGSPIPRILPLAPPSVSPGVPVLPPPAPSTEVPNWPVRVTSVTVEGVTAYPQAEFAAQTAALVGPATPLPQIDAARLSILQRYRADGYVLSAVSINFNVASGQLRFIVTEGRIASVKLDGDIGPAGTQILRFLNRLTEKQPIDLGDAGTLPAIGAGRARGHRSRGPATLRRRSGRPDADRAGQPPADIWPGHRGQPRLRPHRPDRGARRRSTSTASASSARSPRSRSITPSPTARPSARRPSRRSWDRPASSCASMAARGRPRRPASSARRL